MKKLALLCLCFISISIFAQKVSKMPESKLSQKETETHLRILAADEMMGRRTGEMGNNMAARYIAEQFRTLGLKPAGDNGSFYQKVPFKNTKPNTEGYMTIGDSTLKVMDDFITYDGKAIDVQNVPVVFAGAGWVEGDYDDYKGLDVKGKIVIATFGTNKGTDPMASFEASAKKTKIAAEKGAVALIELVQINVPWRNIVRYFGGGGLQLDMNDPAKAAMPHYWVGSSRVKLLAKDKVQTLSIKTMNDVSIPVMSQNVAAILEGSDPTLKNEYIVLSAHYDHVGTGRNGGNKFTAEDSIFNGARDNAFGVSAVLYAAKCLTTMKPKRSILFLGFTGEELGLLGSRYYGEHPLIPMKQCMFNLNCDGAGYNDVTALTTIGLSRTDCKTEMEIAAKAFGLKIIDDPAPEQNLFDRSDNVNFAKYGVPAPCFSPGLKAFDEAIFKYYHQATDNPETIDFNYLHKYCQSYAYAARLIANRKDQPKWTAGDKYEAAYKTLYGK